MQLDSTLIAVRSRKSLDLLDLTVVLCKNYLFTYLLLAFVGFLPWIVIDAVILFPIAGTQIEFSESIVLTTQSQIFLRFTYLQVLLFAVQLPAATLPLTYYIGQQMFHQYPSWRDISANYFSHFWMKFISLGIVRGIIPVSATVAILTYSRDMIAPMELFVLPVIICGPFWLVRALRPFVAEVLVLEQYSGKATSSRQGNNAADQKGRYGKRMKALHELLQSEMVGRFIYVSIVSCALLVILVCTELWVFQFFSPNVTWTWWHSYILMPINLVLLSVFTTVFRFVSYIDTRILLEGWEVRLRLMSEAERLNAD